MEPRVLWVDLTALGEGAPAAPPALPRRGPWARLARWGGSALGLACLREHARRASSGSSALVLAVGEGVRRSLPTAARAAVQARSPLTGRYAEGHVGGELGPRLARVADAVLIEGRCPEPGGVLVLEEGGAARLLARPALLGLAPAEAARALEAELGPCAVLAIGPAGERSIPFASLAAGHSPASFVGRGGLGARFGALGLKALCVRSAPVARAPAADGLLTRLRGSPRLSARARGGTLELFDAWAARGELEPALARRIEGEARERSAGHHGCRGCPTPCGWVFTRTDGPPQGARFGASHALGVALGLEAFDDALRLLATCDRLGIDAKEAGAVLALLCSAREAGRLAGASARGDRAALEAELTALVDDGDAPGRAGAARLAQALGQVGEAPVSRGQAVRPERSRAALLGQCVASGGADPMRTFPFLLESATRERLAELLAPLPVPTEALDPLSGLAKGRLVVWHENLAAAVDLTGFCAFSAAGLLADGLCGLDELAAWILPAALNAPGDEDWKARSRGERLLAAGANLVLARRILEREWGSPASIERAGFAAEALAEAGMLDEYLALRGLASDGAPRREARALLGRPGLLELGRERISAGPPAAAPVPPPVRRAGRLLLSAGGPLAEALGACREVELELPAPLAEVLARAALGEPHLAAQLLAPTGPIPAVWRAGRRLAPDALVEAGDELHLVTAIGGG
jgi:aldehyde:ferredoxin oxidoreductase